MKVLQAIFVSTQSMLLFLAAWKGSEFPIIVFLFHLGLSSALILMSGSKRLLISRTAMLLMLCMLPMMLLELGHWSIYELAPTSAIYLAIFNTDATEIIEFLMAHDLAMFNFFLLGIMILSIGIYRFPLQCTNMNYLVLSLLLLPSVYFHQTIYQQTFLRLIPNYFVFAKEKANFAKRLADFEKLNFKVTRYSTEENTVVFILGESTTRNRLSLYGYARATTPRLELIPDLMVFKNVKSPHTQTFQSLRKVLTLMNSENEKYIKENVHIIDLAKAAGYRTFWISNQKPMGWFENAHSAIASQADEKYWLNPGFRFNSNPPYDEVVFHSVEKVLSKKDKLKFVVIHLMGTHAYYENRFPSRFSHFRGRMGQQKFDLNETEQDSYNNYDNAVLYQDYVITELHKRLRGNYSLVYFPDHGEEVYQLTRYAGHSKLKETVNMLEIPFLVASTDVELKSQASSSLDRTWNTESFIHTLHSLLKIRSSVYDPHQDVFSSGQ